MANVYGNTALTIVASRAGSIQEGFLYRRNPRKDEFSKVQCKDGPKDDPDLTRWLCQDGKATDKLPAFSAIAERYEMMSGDRYLAGLWKSALSDGMAWQFVPYYVPTERGEVYQAPSWSWASINAPIIEAEMVALDVLSVSIFLIAIWVASDRL
ncbi:hypothetical protein BDZ45DRAFT_749205 [Acephala macrosclerotiorum]|nr:hypothetical protein BDZ45DRAFT_749205 [Acephala macrosclerotiorum]